MTLKHLYILLLALVAAGIVEAQSEDIPLENNNQFPLDAPTNTPGDVIEEGSGWDGTTEDPQATEPTPETTPAPELEEVQPTNAVLQSVAVTTEDQSCPNPCVCHYEGTDNFVVDCSGYSLTSFPSPIDPKTTTLNLQNNQLTDIPKDVSSLKNLKVLNAENNKIMDLALGSVSNLPELKVLKLGNNRLIEYPRDLKNSLTLTKLEELDLGGNDMRGDLKPETFSNFKSLRNITLATSTPELLQDLCDYLKDSLETVCTESCKSQLFECDGPLMDNEELIATLPGSIFFEEDNSDPANNAKTEDHTEDTLQETIEGTVSEGKSQNIDQAAIRTFGGALLGNAGPHESKDKEDNLEKHEDKQNLESRQKENTEADISVGATTAEGKSGGGGVDKSVIGIIVAGMVVAVAGITIIKNWSSIRRKFSSSPRPAERAGANANGTSSPEEVPLQDKDKSPV